MAKKPTLPKALKKAEKKAQKRFVEAFEKNYSKHKDTDRAYSKAYKKLEKKYELVKGRWVRIEEADSKKKTKKDDAAQVSASGKKSEGKKASEKKAEPKKNKEKAKKKDSKKVEAKAPAKKKESKKSDSKKSAEKSKKKPSKKKTVNAPKADPILDAELVEPEDLEAFSGSGEDYLEIASEINELVGAGEYEGLDPEDTEDPELAQDLAEETFAEEDLTEVIDDEPLTAVNLTDTSLQGAELAEEAAQATSQELASMTRAQLYKRAQALKIPGRSGMNKEQLIIALAK